MVGVAIVAILATVAFPSFTTLIQRNSATNEANSLLAALTLARGEAIKRNRRVVVCKSADGENCSAGATEWEKGFIVFVDLNANNTLETSDEEVLRVEFPFSTSSSISTSTATGFVAYQPSGLSQSMLTFDIEPNGKPENRREVRLNITGRPFIPRIDEQT